MKQYGKIKADGSIQFAKNPWTVNIANPTEEQKEMLAKLDGSLEVQYTEQPNYNPETQDIKYKFQNIDGKAIQVWEIHDVQPIDEVNEGAKI